MSSYYIYKITSTVTGQYYIGSRYAHVKFNRTPEQDLWIYYFTSSRTVKSMINAYTKDSFMPEILLVSDNPDTIYWAEQDLIKQHIADSKCLNKKYQDKDFGHTIFSTANKPAWNKGIPSKAKGISRTDEIKLKISQGRTGKGLGKAPPNKGIPRSNELKQSQSNNMKGRLVKEKNGFYGKTHSEEVKKRIAENTSNAQKGKPKPKTPCPKCGRLVSAHTRTRHINSCNFNAS